MNKKVMLAVVAIMALGLTIAASAYNHTTVTKTASMSYCCCKGDSCPMNSKDAKAGDKAPCCDKCDCGGDSCPMKMKGEKSKMAGMDMDKTPAKVGMADCCGDSCPMKKKGGDPRAGDVKNVSTDKMRSYGCGCPCCHKEKEKVIVTDAPAI